jgi:hypothetical protein
MRIFLCCAVQRNQTLAFAHGMGGNTGKDQKTAHKITMDFRNKLEARGGIEPPIKVLQTFALPLGDRAPFARLIQEPICQEPNSSHTIGAFQPKQMIPTTIASSGPPVYTRISARPRKNESRAAKERVKRPSAGRREQRQMQATGYGRGRQTAQQKN